MENILKIMFGNKKPIIAMLYFPPSLGHKNFYGIGKSIDEISEDLEIIQEAGFDACLCENEKDSPYKIQPNSEDIASLTIYTQHVVTNSKIPIGFNFLLNDPCASLSIAKASGADFIRSDYFSDEMIRDSDQLIMSVDPTAVKEHQNNLDAKEIKIFADVQVKHAQMIQPRSLLDSAVQTISDGADGLIISGEWTGKAPELDQLKLLVNSKLTKPIIIGSGLNSNNSKQLLELSQGAIVGTSILSYGRVDKKKAFNLMDSIS
jgi:uncharacterized protein